MIKRFLSRIILKVFGWKVIKNTPADLKKAVLIAVPHTSNWDFIWAMPAIALLQTKVRYLIKNDYFNSPLAFIFKWTGGIPVDRSKSNNMSNNLKSMVSKHEELFLLFPPEGTRKRVKRWRTGFYYVAKDAELPICLGFIDYEKKELGYAGVYYPTWNFEEDMQYLEKFYENITPKHPNDFNKEFYVRGEERP